MALNINTALEDDDLIIDEVSGFAVNVPAQDQKPYKWWLMFPESYARILQIRLMLGLKTVDDLTGKSNENALDKLFGEGK